MPDEDVLAADVFDEVFARVAEAPHTNELFDQVLGPFPAGVEPFSLVPRAGLDRILAELRLGRGEHLLDLCCGRGGIGLWFASVSDARLTGVDFSAAAIAGASRRTEAFLPRSRASFIVADAADTALPANSVDAVVCIDSLQFAPDKTALLREVARVLRPGGRVVVTTWERRGGKPADLPANYTIADAGALAEAAGLRVLAREERDDWQEQERAFYQRDCRRQRHRGTRASPTRPGRTRPSPLLSVRSPAAAGRASVTGAFPSCTLAAGSCRTPHAIIVRYQESRSGRMGMQGSEQASASCRLPA